MSPFLGNLGEPLLSGPIFLPGNREGMVMMMIFSEDNCREGWCRAEGGDGAEIGQALPGRCWSQSRSRALAGDQAASVSRS